MQIVGNSKTRSYSAGVIFMLGLTLHNTCISQSLPTSRYQIRSGQAANYTVINFNQYFGRRPVLSAFSFEFAYSGDFHLKDISVLLENGPNYGNSFSDDNHELPYIYKTAATLIHPDNILSEGFIGGMCDSDIEIRIPGVCRRQLPPPPEEDAVFVIRNFYLSFFPHDHKVDQLGIYERDGRVWIHFNDADDNDDFSYHVKYFYLPRAIFAELGQRSGFDQGESELSFARGIPVIRGFSFDFRSNDHNIDRIAVDLELDGTGKLRFDDKNDDDDYDYVLDYGILPYVPWARPATTIDFRR